MSSVGDPSRKSREFAYLTLQPSLLTTFHKPGCNRTITIGKCLPVRRVFVLQHRRIAANHPADFCNLP
uniref:Uncharacterized protein n=1 Tax=Anopheles dirus TaxID=7168 RepID=A0A182NXY0_9DIPT